MMNKYDLRQRMRKVIKPNLQTLLVIALIAALPGLLASVVTTMTGSALADYLYKHGVDTSATLERLTEALEGFLAERGWVAPVMFLLQALTAPVLTLGLINAILTLLRGGTITFATAFSRLRSFPRAVGVALLVYLKVFLWALAAVPLMLLAFILLMRTGSLTGYTLLMTGSSSLMMALTIMASYRYAMSNFFLADEPETGVPACVRRSKAVMKGRKMQLFQLELPYLVGNWLAASVISMLLAGVIGTTLSMLVQLIFTVYLYGARCAFFEACVHRRGIAPQPAPTDADDEEMKDWLN